MKPGFLYRLAAGGARSVAQRRGGSVPAPAGRRAPAQVPAPEPGPGPAPTPAATRPELPPDTVQPAPPPPPIGRVATVPVGTGSAAVAEGPGRGAAAEASRPGLPMSPAIPPAPDAAPEAEPDAPAPIVDWPEQPPRRPPDPVPPAAAPAASRPHPERWRLPVSIMVEEVPVAPAEVLRPPAGEPAAPLAGVFRPPAGESTAPLPTDAGDAAPLPESPGIDQTPAPGPRPVPDRASKPGGEPALPRRPALAAPAPFREAADTGGPRDLPFRRPADITIHRLEVQLVDSSRKDPFAAFEPSSPETPAPAPPRSVEWPWPDRQHLGRIW